MKPRARVDVLLAQFGFHAFHAGPDEDRIPRLDLHALPLFGRFEIRCRHILVGLVPRHPTCRGDIQQDATGEDSLTLSVNGAPLRSAGGQRFRALAAVVKLVVPREMTQRVHVCDHHPVRCDGEVVAAARALGFAVDHHVHDGLSVGLALLRGEVPARRHDLAQFDQCRCRDAFLRSDVVERPQFVIGSPAPGIRAAVEHRFQLGVGQIPCARSLSRGSRPRGSLRRSRGAGR